MTVKLRLTAGLLGQGYSQAVTIGAQLVSVPVLIGLWGVEQYGAWLLISAIPTYLALADLGFAQVGAAEMTMRVARGDRASAAIAFHTVFAMNCIIGLTVFCGMAAVALSPLSVSLMGQAYTNSAIPLVLLALSLHALLSLLQGILGAGMRSEGHFALMSFTFATLRLADISAVMLAAWFGGDLLDAALAMLVTRAVLTALVAFLIQRRWSWLRLGFANARVEEARRMLRPSLHFLGYTLGNLVSIQGATIVIGAVLGPAAVAVTSTTRTLARLGVTGANMLNFTLQPEYSMRYAEGGSGGLTKLFRFHILTIIAVAVVYVCFMLGLGSSFYAVWTKAKIEMPAMLFSFLLMGSAVDMLWTALQTPAIATNRMKLTGPAYLIVSCLGLAALAYYSPREGVVAFGAVAFAGAVAMLVIAYAEYRKLQRQS
ncbi:MAG: hypothetical protein BGO57_15085 [Sphingomonadales bacterium 63-6]|nr:MAG: hypothetical protein BGO57_15085 [Sphingomonadales bacterium 63-6]